MIKLQKDGLFTNKVTSEGNLLCLIIFTGIRVKSLNTEAHLTFENYALLNITIGGLIL